MKIGPKIIASRLHEVIPLDARPLPAREYITRFLLESGVCANKMEAQEKAEYYEAGVISRLQIEICTLNSLGRPLVIDFNSTSIELLQGGCFCEPNDSKTTKEIKNNRLYFKDYLSEIAKLNFNEFEQLCGGIIQLLGVDDVIVTQVSKDEGIDFFGQAKLENLFFEDREVPSLIKRGKLWIVGQAKHYQKNNISTPQIRELVGSVQLAQAKAFGGDYHENFDKLDIKICDPILYVFITSGHITSSSWKLLERSGVIGFDGAMIANFLAENNIGITGGSFSADSFRSWVRERIPLS